MQYSSSSFAETLVGLFRWALQPTVRRPNLEGPFPRDTDFETHIEDTVLHKAVLPTSRTAAWLFAWGRYLQSGSLQAYLMYILIVLVVFAISV